MAATPAAPGLDIAAPPSDPPAPPLAVVVAQGGTAMVDDPAIAGDLEPVEGSPAGDPPVAVQGPVDVAETLCREEAFQVGASLEPASSTASMLASGPASSQDPMAPANGGVSGEEPAAASPASEGALTAASAEAPPARRGRLARLRHLVRDCFEEVACTFQGQGEDADPPLKRPSPPPSRPGPRWRVRWRPFRLNRMRCTRSP